MELRTPLLRSNFLFVCIILVVCDNPVGSDSPDDASMTMTDPKDRMEQTEDAPLQTTKGDKDVPMDLVLPPREAPQGSVTSLDTGTGGI